MGVSVLFFCAETFPPVYAFLQKVFNGYVREAGYRMVWVMPSVDTERVQQVDWDGSPVVLIPKLRPKGLVNILEGYWRHLQYIRTAAQIALERYGPFDLVQVRDDPAMAWVAWRLAKKWKVPFVYQLSHLKEEETILYAKMEIYGSPLKNLIQGKVGLLLRNFLLKRADLVLPISEQMKETLAGYGVPRDRMVPLPEGVDTSTDPESLNAEAQRLRPELGLEGKKVLIYVGTMNRFRQLDFLLEVFREVLRQHPNAHLLMVGGGKRQDDLVFLKKKAKELGIVDHVTFTGFVPRERVPVYIRASDVGLSPFSPNPVLINNSPIKPLEYLALEIPVVGSDIPDQKKVIGESRGGIWASHERQAFVDAINSLLKLSPQERKAMGKRGREYVQKKRDFKVLAEMVLQTYSRLFRP